MEENTQTVLTGAVPQETGETAAVPAPAKDLPAGAGPEEAALSPAGEGETGEPEDLIPYRFNHKTETVSRREAPEMIQKLLKAQKEAEKALPLLDKLRYLAQAGESTPEEYLARLEEELDQREYDRFLQSAGGNGEIAGKLLEMSREERRRQFKPTALLRREQEEREREETTRRMGEQLADLQREFPEIKEFRDLPEEVVRQSLQEEIPLLDSLLRYRHRNGIRALAQKERQEKAAAASAGSLRGEPEHREKTDGNVAAFIAAFRG